MTVTVFEIPSGQASPHRIETVSQRLASGPLAAFPGWRRGVTSRKYDNPALQGPFTGSEFAGDNPRFFKPTHESRRRPSE